MKKLGPAVREKYLLRRINQLANQLSELCKRKVDWNLAEKGDLVPIKKRKWNLLNWAAEVVIPMSRLSSVGLSKQISFEIMLRRNWDCWVLSCWVRRHWLLCSWFFHDFYEFSSFFRSSIIFFSSCSFLEIRPSEPTKNDTSSRKNFTSEQRVSMVWRHKRGPEVEVTFFVLGHSFFFLLLNKRTKVEPEKKEELKENMFTIP